MSVRGSSVAMWPHCHKDEEDGQVAATIEEVGKEKPDPCGSGCSLSARGRLSPSRGEQLPAVRLQSGRMGNRSPTANFPSMRSNERDNIARCMPAMQMRRGHDVASNGFACSLEMPALCFGD